ncbi:MAG: dolichol-phosphate mannosyltransferase [Glaciecola sp.]|jgi:dolichol-phosphate mannosyltransferase
MQRTLVVMPTYNEAQNIHEIVAAVLARPVGVDLLIVDDGSPDGTGDLADLLADGEPRLRVLHRTSKSGLGSAYRAGLGQGLDEGYEILVEMDADLSHPPEALDALIAATSEHDLVLGSRYVTGGGVQNWPWYRRALSSGGNRYVRLATGMPLGDATSGFRAFRRDVLETINIRELRSEGYSFQLEAALVTWRAGFSIAEVPITFVERTAGASKISRSIVLEALWRVLWWGIRGPRGPERMHVRSVTSTTGG